MQIYCSSSKWVNYKRPAKDIRQVKDSGFDGVFIDLERYMSKELSAEVACQNVIAVCSEFGIRSDIVCTQSKRAIAAMEQKTSYDNAKGDFASEDNIKLGNMVLLKNQYRNFNGHYIRGRFCDGIETAKTIDEMNHEADFEKYGFCLDVGVCNLCGQNMYDYILALGNRIKAVILRDNDGDKDNSLLPFTSVNAGSSHTDWLGLIKGLRAIDFDGILVMDFSDSICAMPIQLRYSYLRYAYEMGEYLKWQISMERMIKKYDTRVLFGAGNMCRAYMKCYGRQYPPLFTCDNNKALWGTQFEGLTVKNPEELRNIPSDCAILICNLYYEEIKEQLRQMNLPNPIEFFNDEYMPSFHFRRIDAETREIITL